MKYMNTCKIISISQIHEYITLYVISYIIYNTIFMGDGLVQDCGNFIDIYHSLALNSQYIL